MRQFIPLLIFVFILLSCEEIDNSEQSTWNIIENKILATSCANCHVTGSAMTKQSGLDLSQNDSYNSVQIWRNPIFEKVFYIFYLRCSCPNCFSY